MRLTGLLVATSLAALLLALAAWGNRRRGIDRLSLIPWDHLMIVAAGTLVALLALTAIAWRDS